MIAGLRPEAFSTAGAASVTVEVAAVENLGTESHVCSASTPQPVGVATHRVVDESGPAFVARDVDGLHRPARARRQVRGQASTLIASDRRPERLYLFDADTGITLLA